MNAKRPCCSIRWHASQCSPTTKLSLPFQGFIRVNSSEGSCGFLLLHIFVIDILPHNIYGTALPVCWYFQSVCLSEKLLIVTINLTLLKMHNMGHACVVLIPLRYLNFFIVSVYVGEYNLAFSSTLVRSSTSKNCQDIKLHWNPSQYSNVSYIIRVLSLEEEENLTAEWNATTQNSSVIIPHDQLEVGLTYEAELAVVVTNDDPSLPTEIITVQLLNITLPACSTPKG